MIAEAEADDKKEVKHIDEELNAEPGEPPKERRHKRILLANDLLSDERRIDGHVLGQVLDKSGNRSIEFVGPANPAWSPEFGGTRSFVPGDAFNLGIG